MQLKAILLSAVVAMVVLTPVIEANSGGNTSPLEDVVVMEEALQRSLFLRISHPVTHQAKPIRFRFQYRVV